MLRRYGKASTDLDRLSELHWATCGRPTCRQPGLPGSEPLRAWTARPESANPSRCTAGSSKLSTSRTSLQDTARKPSTANATPQCSSQDRGRGAHQSKNTPSCTCGMLHLGAEKLTSLRSAAPKTSADRWCVGQDRRNGWQDEPWRRTLARSAHNLPSSKRLSGLELKTRCRLSSCLAGTLNRAAATAAEQTGARP